MSGDLGSDVEIEVSVPSVKKVGQIVTVVPALSGDQERTECLLHPITHPSQHHMKMGVFDAHCLCELAPFETFDQRQGHEFAVSLLEPRHSRPDEFLEFRLSEPERWVRLADELLREVFYQVLLGSIPTNGVRLVSGDGKQPGTKLRRVSKL